MTWNVWWRFGDWEPRQNAIQQVLKEVDAAALAVVDDVKKVVRIFKYVIDGKLN